MDCALASICEELSVKPVPLDRNWSRGAGETCATQTLGRILENYGEAHLRSTLITIMETANNQRMLVAPVIWAISDILRAHPDWFSSKWLDAFDRIELAQVHAQAKANRKAAQIRPAIATILFAALRPIFNNETQGKLI